MSIPRDEMIRRMQMAADSAAFHARNKNLTASQRQQLAAPHLAMQNFWQGQMEGAQNYGRARQLQTDRLSTSTTNAMIGRLGLQRRAPGFGSGMYAGRTQEEWMNSTPNFYEYGMPRLRSAGFNSTMNQPSDGGNVTGSYGQDDEYGY